MVPNKKVLSRIAQLDLKVQYFELEFDDSFNSKGQDFYFTGWTKLQWLHLQSGIHPFQVITAPGTEYIFSNMDLAKAQLIHLDFDEILAYISSRSQNENKVIQWWFHTLCKRDVEKHLLVMFTKYFEK